MSADTAAGSASERIVQHQLDAYNVHDLEAFLAVYSPDVTVLRHDTGEVVIDGSAAMRAAYGQLFAANPSVHCAIDSRMVLGRYVIDEERITGRADGVELHVIVIYEVVGELIQRTWVLRG